MLSLRSYRGYQALIDVGFEGMVLWVRVLDLMGMIYKRVQDYIRLLDKGNEAAIRKYRKIKDLVGW